MIRRKYSYAYIEFIRGRYSLQDTNSILDLFQDMVPGEISKINTAKSLDELWNEIWVKETKMLRKDKRNSRLKWKKIQNGYLKHRSETLTLQYITDRVHTNFKEPEWGFAKGRRNLHETDLKCAMREFTEETGYSSDAIRVLSRSPFIEIFHGSDGKVYKNKYYLCFMDHSPTRRKHDTEIGAIGWFNLRLGLQKLRT